MSLQFPSHDIQHPCARTFREDNEIIANNLIPFTCHNTRRRERRRRRRRSRWGGDEEEEEGGEGFCLMNPYQVEKR